MYGIGEGACTELGMGHVTVLGMGHVRYWGWGMHGTEWRGSACTEMGKGHVWNQPLYICTNTHWGLAHTLHCLPLLQ